MAIETKVFFDPGMPGDRNIAVRAFGDDGKFSCQAWLWLTRAELETLVEQGQAALGKPTAETADQRTLRLIQQHGSPDMAQFFAEQVGLPVPA